MTRSTKLANEESNCIIDLAQIEKVMAMYSQLSSLSAEYDNDNDDCDFSDSDYDDDDDESNLSDHEREQLLIQSLEKQNEELKNEILLTAQKKAILYKSVQGLEQMEAMRSK